MAVEVRTYAGVPPVAAFASASGTPIVINNLTNTPYYLAPGDVVTALGGAGLTNPMTTAGDLIVGGVAGAPARLAAGANGQPLVLAAGAEQWGYTANALTDAASVAIDASVPYNTLLFTSAVGNSRTIANPTNALAARPLFILTQQDTVGNRQIAWDTKYVGSFFTMNSGGGSNTPPQPTQVANVTDLFRCDYNAALDKWVVGITRGYRCSEWAHGQGNRPANLSTTWFYYDSELPAVQFSLTSGIARGILSTTGAIDRMFEVTMDADSAGSPGAQMCGVCESTANFGNFVGGDTHGWGYFGNDGKAYLAGAAGAVYGASYGGNTNRNIIGVRVDATGNLIFYKDGVSQGTAVGGLSAKVLFPAVSSGSALNFRRMMLNTGQQPFQFPVAGSQAWG